MILSVDILNLRSPYKLTPLGELTFRFVTDQQLPNEQCHMAKIIL